MVSIIMAGSSDLVSAGGLPASGASLFSLVLGAQLKLVLGLFGFGLDSVSFRFGFVLGSVSIPLGFILDSISIRCMHIVSDVWDSISAIWN